jgi:DnaJ family protein C protein 13
LFLNLTKIIIIFTDKNPDGRDIFEKVNKAYEYLCNSSHIGNGPNELNIYLILQTQIILYKRFSELLMPYKYAGYIMLIKTINTETNDEQLFSKKVRLINVTTELCYQTIRCSALNAEELRRENGLDILHSAFQRCGSVLNQYSKNDDELSVHVCIHIANCYRVASQFSDCREKFLQLKTLFKDLCRCMNFKQLSNLLITTSETIGELSKNDINEQQLVKMELFKYGALYHLLYYLFFYDFTLDESEVERNTESNQQEIANNLSRICLNSLLSLLNTNLRIKQSLISLLTPHLVTCLQTFDSNQFLKLFNSNTRNPYLIWNNITRAELTAFIEHEREYLYKYGQVEDVDFGLKFKYDSLTNELIIGDVYVRVYNEQPTYQLIDAKKFCANLLDYIGSHAQYMSSGGLQGGKLENIEMSLEALRNVLRNNDGVEFQCIGHFRLLFTLLRLVTNVSDLTRIQMLLLEIILQTTSNKDCVNDIAQSNVLVNLLLVLYKLPQAQQIILECIYALASNQKLVKDFIYAGGLLYVLNIFTTNSMAQIRQKSAELFAKLMSDKLTGPKIKLLLQRFLPPLFMDAMKDSSETAVITFEGNYENPELIWNEDIRKKVTETIRQMTQTHFEEQCKNLEYRWSLPDELNDSNVASQATLYSGGSQNEVVIGGVFIRLFIANPGWVLRKPKEFLIELFETWAEMGIRKQQEGEQFEQITQALVQLFQAQPLLLDLVPQMGSLPQVKEALLVKRDGIIGSAILILNQIVNNDTCLKSMCIYDWMQAIKNGMQKRSDLIATCAELLSKIFSSPSSQIVDEFVSQALRCELIEFLLQLLESPMERIEKPAAVKALIVKALKSMLNSLQHSIKVRNEVI